MKLKILPLNHCFIQIDIYCQYNNNLAFFVLAVNQVDKFDCFNVFSHVILDPASKMRH